MVLLENDNASFESLARIGDAHRASTATSNASKPSRFRVRNDLLQVHEFEDGTGRGLCVQAPTATSSAEALSDHISEGAVDNKEDQVVVSRGVVLVEVPVNFTINAKTAREILPEIIPNDLSNDDAVAVLLMWARCNRTKIPEWLNLHLDLLPRVEEGPSALNQTMFWTEEELELMQGSPAYVLANQLKMQVRQDFGVIVSCVFLPNPDMFPLMDENLSKHFTYQEYKWALAVVWSRGMDFVGGAADGVGTLRCIVPCADMFNTRRDIKTCHFFSQKNNTIGVMAAEPMKAGDQAFINYGPVGNARMGQLYGFALSPNIDDHVELWATMDANDPRHAEVSAQLASVAPGVNPNTEAFKLTVKEPLPESLLWTLRIQRGLNPFVKLNDDSDANEGQLAVLMMLEMALSDMLSAYKGDQVIDVAELNKNDLPERRRIALGVRVGERRILLAALTANGKLIRSAGGNSAFLSRVENEKEKAELVDEVAAVTDELANTDLGDLADLD